MKIFKSLFWTFCLFLLVICTIEVVGCGECLLLNKENVSRTQLNQSLVQQNPLLKISQILLILKQYGYGKRN